MTPTVGRIAVAPCFLYERPCLNLPHVIWEEDALLTLKVILCDDDPSWLDREQRAVRSFAAEKGAQLDLWCCTSGSALLAEAPFIPDILFADIELGPDENGIDIVKAVTEAHPSCQVVYVTNHLRYALDVYTTAHLWFVLKEQFEERLPTILKKLEQQMEDGAKELLIQTTGHDLLMLPCPSITFIERRTRTSTITCNDGQAYRVHDRLAELLERLPERTFVRCHGSFVVGLNHVRLVRRDCIVLQDGTEVPLSRRYAHAFRERYLEWADDHAL